MKKESCWISFLEYLVLILCLLSNNTVYSTSLYFDFHFTELVMLVSIVLAVCEFRTITRKILYRWVAFLIAYESLNVIIIIMSVAKNRITGYATRFIIFIPLMVLHILCQAKKGHLWDFFEKYKKIVVIYSLMTVILWLVLYIWKDFPPTSTIMSGWGRDYQYPLYFGLLTVRQYEPFLGIRWMRNMGFYAEAPMFSFVILLAIIIELFITPLNKAGSPKSFLDGVNKKELLILVIAEISTVTTTGMIFIVGMFALKYCLYQEKKMLFKEIKFFATIAVGIAAIIMISMIFSGKASSSSWIERLDDIKAGYLAWQDHLWFGNGYDKMDAIENYMGEFRLYNMGYSSGIFSVLAQGGIFFGLIYLMGMFGFIRYGFSNRKTGPIMAIGMFAVLLMISIVQNSFLTMWILAYGYALSMVPNEKRLKREVYLVKSKL